LKLSIQALIITLTVILATPTYAQDNGKFDISGTVLDSGTGEGVYMASAVIKELGLWALTDDKGAFEIKGVPSGKFTFEFSLLGYETVSQTYEIKKDIRTLKIKMSQSSLTLDEVVVTAKEGGEITSSSKISQQTIEHVQPSSLKDVMQLLPGSITENPTLTSMNSISIRDIGENSANAIGTALVVDGASMNNDANLQVMSSGKTINDSEANAVSSAGGGVDTRQISTDNIESVEVIRGIPSVVYGDMTSGAVVVKTKAGVTPWEIRLKTDPHLKQVSAGKGFSVGEKGGALNFEADYAYAYNDIRTPSSAYQRVNFQAGYSNFFAKKVQFNAKIHANWSNATNASDPDLHLDEIAQQKDKSIRLNINGRWIISKPWITNIEYMASGSITDQYSRDRSYQGSAGYTPTTTEISNHEGIGFYTLPQYYSDVEIFGRPINGQARITANLFGQYGIIKNKALIGAEWKADGNTGSGKQFDPQCTPYPSAATAYRNRSYSDIPFLHHITAYIEDNITIPLGSTSLELQAGARFNHITANGLNTSAFDRIEPRTNARYTIVKKQNGLRELSVRGGWGLNYKMPSMIYLYPENAYKDMVSFNYTDFDASGYGMNIITTKVVETLNNSLKPQRSRNIEAGIEFDTKPVKGSLVYYNEKMTDGYGFVTEFLPMVYNRYGYEWKNDSRSAVRRVDEFYQSGLQFNYTGNKLCTTDGRTVPSISDTTFISYNRPVNGIDNDKWGVEFTLDFARIKPLNTTISVSGAYMSIRSRNTQYDYQHYSGSAGGRTYQYVGIYGGSSKSSNGSQKERFSTNVRFITHIPKIGMVVTLTAQMVFLDRTRYLSDFRGESLPYYYDDLGNRITGDAAINDTEHTKYINPMMVMDRSGRLTTFTREMETDPSYRDLIITTNTPTYYISQSYPFYGMLNLRLTKEIKKIATISFYANNFLNLRGRVENSVTHYPTDKNTPIYFGAEVKLTIK